MTPISILADAHLPTPDAQGEQLFQLEAIELVVCIRDEAKKGDDYAKALEIVLEECWEYANRRDLAARNLLRAAEAFIRESEGK
jgi:hypothetical protein